MGEAEPEAKAGLLERMLGFIERVGNKVPHPAVLFLGLCVGLILLSQVLAWAGWSATYEVVKPPAEVAEELDIGGRCCRPSWCPASRPTRTPTRSSPRPLRSRGCCPPTASASCSPRSSRTSWRSPRWASSSS
ncbi:MAG: AbgT family transporter [Acidimicrobiales bacterium]